MTTKLNFDECVSKVLLMKERGTKIYVISDNDNDIWESGLADFLMSNYFYINGRKHCKVYLTKPITK